MTGARYWQGLFEFYMLSLTTSVFFLLAESHCVFISHLSIHLSKQLRCVKQTTVVYPILTFDDPLAKT